MGLSTEKADFLIIGGGVIGISIALELKRRYADAVIKVIEKELDIGAHGSGRNSGVLHAGFYYTADSLKAKFTREGNIAWRNYCQEKSLKINHCGKLVVASGPDEVEGLAELKSRGEKNGVELEWVSDTEARSIEPKVKTYEAALWSPNTASVDPLEIMKSLAEDAQDAGIELKMAECFISYDPSKNLTKTNRGIYSAGFVVNAAGLYADRVALQFSFSKKYRIIPFKGLYLYADEAAYKPRTNIYPVPNLKNPFLGVHFTITVDGKSKIGPTAIPAFWRENYQGMDNFRAHEMLEIVLREAELFAFNRFGFRTLALEEAKKYGRRYMETCAAKMLGDIVPGTYRKWGRPGIRAQLIDLERKALEMDFKVEGDGKSLHVLNAVSPAFTCAYPFACHISDMIEKKH